MRDVNPLSRPMRRPLLVSFSGVDGAGKSTQIENLCERLADAGCSTRLLTFWDDVVVLSRHREAFVDNVYKSEKGIGAPGKPVERRDKNVRKWYLTVARHGLYFLDALHLASVVAKARRSKPDVIIMDRYIYDEWANLPLGNPLSRLYIWLVQQVVPQPDIAYLLDADPEAARRRKPEYPLEFMRECRRSYRRLAEL
ncbi:MAG: thymidylate kinase, partial [Acidobacteriaceae bacterium]|nr:thymidylate kinase [Acidobacteriaceae bacterium]